MRNIYNAKTYFEEILLGSNSEGIGFINESSRNHFQKSFSFLGGGFNQNYAQEIVSVGLIGGNRLEIGVDSRAIQTNSYCDCLKNDVCRKLMISSSSVQVIPKKQYRAHLQPGKKVGHLNLAGNAYGSLGFFLLPYAQGKNPLIVSNNHVLADCNNGVIGDPVFLLNGNAQRIGHLDNYVPIYSSRENILDLAVAELSGFENSMPQGSAGYRNPFIGEKVYKVGATTGRTFGVVRSLNYTSKINYDGFSAVFVDQIQITSGISGFSFSAGGDSGSVIKSSRDNALVGLLFAGNGTWTLANHQTQVVKQLKDWGYNIK